MLCATIDDPVESGGGVVDGLGLLGASVRFAEEKVLGRPAGTWRGLPVEGYEIHHGVVSDDGSFPGGCTRGAAWGTIWHGTLEGDAFRRAWLGEVAEAAGSSWRPRPSAPGFAQRREAMIDALADAVSEHLDVAALLDLAGRTMPR